MSDTSAAIANPLLQESLPLKSSSGCKNAIRLSILGGLGLAILLGMMIYILGRGNQPLESNAITTMSDASVRRLQVDNKFHVVNTKDMLGKVPHIRIVGDDQQMLHIILSPGEECWSEPGCMIHCDNEIRPQVDFGNDGCFGCFKRACVAGISLVRDRWKNMDRDKPKMLGLGAAFPAKVIPVNLDAWQGEIFVKHHSFLAAIDPNIQFNVERVGKRTGGFLSKGMLAGQGFILNKIVGRDWIFLSGSGAIFQKTLGADETIVVDPLCLVAWERSCHFGYRFTGGIGVMCFGGQGVTDTTLTGPGRVIMQSMPFEKTKRLFQAKPPPQPDSQNK
eukprot:gnl/MRDRNA2_/MRDRNA2_52133_c0_seq1.p1 gnl/MRDRNA2_/MRDRNA2_52133_c0~~gnl/MRDRNA2_/MRDRNA2_52133_c0_seq1.p1  ORF type:complete len:344 (+),score=49.51 gnl/MRDRNA2_/MRDRNA2_52133_c0_seq1:31-1032(+)